MYADRNEHAEADVLANLEEVLWLLIIIF